MASKDMSGTPGEGRIRREPSYSEVVKATPGGAKDTSTTATSGFWSAGNASLGTGLTAPTPLFSPSIWSPIQQGTQSATIPRKLSWETTVNGKATQMFTNTPPQSGAAGLGLQFGDGKTSNGKHANAPVTKINLGTTTPGQFDLAANSTPYKYKQQDIAHAQAKPFQREGGVQLPNTAPLVQQPFYGLGGDSGLERTTSNLAGTEVTNAIDPFVSDKTSNTFGSVNQPPSSTRVLIHLASSEGGSEGAGSDRLRITSPDASASDLSHISEISEHVEAAERDKQETAPVLAEEAHPRNFARTQMDGSVSFGSAFPGSEAVVTAINPSHYCMEYGSRVVCIKTDFVENIHWAIQHGMWGVMEKVAARIMTLWNAKSGGKDKVILIFSVNGQKSYCGLAEMSGPWKEAEGGIEGFKIKKDGLSRTWGTMSITWIFIKNISYYWFRDIKNPHNDQDVVNMWNGMHFPSDIAREVVELIIKRPHFTNVLAWREDMTYDPFKPVLDAQQIDPLAGDGKKMNVAMRMIDNGRPGGHGRKGHALAVTNWRQPQEQDEEATDPSIVGPNHRHGAAKQFMTSTTPPNLDGHTSPRPRHGQLVTCYMDENGNFVPVTPSADLSKTPVASSNHSLIDLDTPRGVYPAFGQRGGFNNATARGGLINHRGGRGGHATARGNFGGVNSPRGATRVAIMPHYARTQQSFAGYVDPQIRRMKSDIGLEDPFGNPRMPVQTNTMPLVMQQSANAQAVSNSQAATFQRAVGSANFVPQNLRAPAATTTSAAQAFGATTSYGNVTPQPHAPAHSGGVMLTPSPSYRTGETTPSRMPGQGSVKSETVEQPLIPAGQHMYPSSTDHVQAQKNTKTSPDVDRLHLEYLESLQHELAVKRQINGLRLKKAGGAVPDHLKEESKSDRKGD